MGKNDISEMQKQLGTLTIFEDHFYLPQKTKFEAY